MNRSDYQRRRINDLLSQKPRPRHSPDSPAMKSKCFDRRLDKAWQAGLFKAARPWDPVSSMLVVAEMTRIATEIYGLVYEGEGNSCCWTAPHDGTPTRKDSEKGRTGPWLTNIRNGICGSTS